eukprot:symbB.v1.2.029759.t1/scaffold3293.1/size59574/8
MILDRREDAPEILRQVPFLRSFMEKLRSCISNRHDRNLKGHSVTVWDFGQQQGLREFDFPVVSKSIKSTFASSQQKESSLLQTVAPQETLLIFCRHVESLGFAGGSATATTTFLCLCDAQWSLRTAESYAGVGAEQS